ncbi:MAG: TIGR04283 family arsenosugar biosynthesis glycosyltransferase, partial [bacterium]
VLLFLHCDTRLPPDAARRVREALARGCLWGWFDLRLDARGAAYRVVERMINLRARASGIATGDQAMFVLRRVFEQQRGFAGIALMEDVEMSHRLKRLGRPGRIAQAALTSARRWRRHGLARTIWLMWKLRFQYWRGARPDALATRYRDAR